jgi:hypothetical protein
MNALGEATEFGATYLDYFCINHSTVCICDENKKMHGRVLKICVLLGKIESVTNLHS